MKKKKEMIQLTDETNKSYHNQKVVINVKKNLVLMMTVELHLIKNTIKSEIIVILQENIEDLLIISGI